MFRNALIVVAALSTGAVSAQDWSVKAPAWTEFAAAAAPTEPGVAGVAPSAPMTWRLVDTRWGWVSALSLGLADTLEGCPGSDAGLIAALRATPHRYTTTTVRAVTAARACKPALIDAGGSTGAVSSAVWRELAGDHPEPDALERAKTIAFGAAGLNADYDRSSWELEPRPNADPGAVFIWGPLRATAGYGCTVQKVLKIVYEQAPTRARVEAAFEDDPALLNLLLRQAAGPACAEAAQALRPVFDDPDRRATLQVRFGQLAEHADVRAAYDRFFFGPQGYLSRRVSRYAAVYAAAGLTPSQADWGWFLDHALNYPVLDDAAVANLAGLLRAEPPTSNAAARRRLALAFAYRNPRSRLYRLGRDAAWYVDAVGEAGLTAEERSAWIAHSRLRASDVGLSDRAWSPSCERLWLDACGPRS